MPARQVMSSPAFLRALDQAREIRRRKTRESAQAAERLWFSYVQEMLAGDLPAATSRKGAK